MRFNANVATTTRTENFAGGEAFTESPELELVSLLLTSFLQDQFYRSGSDTLVKLQKLLRVVPPQFAARAAIFARREFGMRTVSHVVAGELCKLVSTRSWMKGFLNSVVYRPDDITEITAYYLQQRVQGQDKVTNAMRKGLGAALSRFDEYQLAKYRAEGSAVSLVDCVNLYHPKHTPALEKLVKGTLKAPDTWEVGLTRAGQEATSDAEKAELKAKTWRELLETKKLGYFALLRNLRNIAEQAPDCIDMAAEVLVDEHLIKKSLVLPFRFSTAMKELQKVRNSRKLVSAVSKALDIAVSNCPTLPGRTLIALDDSGSMQGKPIEIGSLFAAVLYKSNDADLLQFSDDARYKTYDPNNSVLGIAQAISSNLAYGGTNFNSIFRAAGLVPYDRIIILSDMQGWVGWHAPTKELEAYRRRTGANPHIYSFDLQGYGTLQFPERQVYCLAGFSEKVFDIMKLLEQSKGALIDKIKEVPLHLS